MQQKYYALPRVQEAQNILGNIIFCTPPRAGQLRIFLELLCTSSSACRSMKLHSPVRGGQRLSCACRSNPARTGANNSCKTTILAPSCTYRIPVFFCSCTYRIVLCFVEVFFCQGARNYGRECTL